MNTGRSSRSERAPSDREQVILDHMPLVVGLARRYARRGEALEDLIQVGTEGLIKAVDRFDPTRGTSLVAFATPTILGEIRRHFRDRLRMVHVPRGLQDAHMKVNRAATDLTTRLGRTPAIRELATEVDLSEEEVLDALASGAAFQPLSLSRMSGSSDDESAIDVGGDDPGFELAESRATLSRTLSLLTPRDRLIVSLRFGRGLTQSEIAAQLGISQMHVSRLLRRAILTLRAALDPEDLGSPS